MARKFALTVGVNQYKQPVRSLKFAINDAVAMRSYLLNDLGFDEVLHYSDQESDPNRYGTPERTDLLLGIQRISSNLSLNAGDSFWFFFSGHGGRQGGRDFLLPTGGHPDLLGDTAIPIDRVVRALSQCGAGNLVLILDACRNVIPEYGKGDNQTEALVKQEGIITFFSCSPKQKSYELPDYKHGAFTYALLQALRGECAPSQCKAEELSRHLRNSVPKLAQSFGPQLPYVIAEPIEKGMQTLLPSDKIVILPPPAPPSAHVPGKAIAPNVAADLIRQAVRVTQQKQWIEAENLWDKILIEADDHEDRTFAREQLDFVRQQMSLASPPSPSITSNPSPISASPPSPSITSNPSPISAPPLSPAPASSPTSLLLTVSFETVRVNDSGEIVERIPKKAQYFTEDLGDGVTFDMIQIERGEFEMGSAEGVGYDDERPQHRVTVPSFYMGKVVVTQAVYERVMGKNPATRFDRDRFIAPNKPIVNVSWNDAIAFCKALNQRSPLGQNYRLPSEAEWEYACRAGTTTKYSFGNAIAPKLANQSLVNDKTVTVDSYFPNNFGLFNMHGNVWEWCKDRWHQRYKYNEGGLFKKKIEIAPNNGNAWIENGDSDRRVLRGGSWVNIPWFCRSATRYWFDADYRSNVIGFRLVCSSPRT